jgi:hypothetical protein
VDSRKVRTRIKIDDRISKKGSHILGHKQLFNDGARALLEGWASSPAGALVLAA